MNNGITPTFAVQEESFSQLRADYLSDKIKKLVRSLIIKNIDENNGMYYEFDKYDNSIAEIKKQNTKTAYISETITPYVVWCANHSMKVFYGVDLQVFNFKVQTIDEISNLEYTVNSSTEANISIIYLFIVVAFLNNFQSNKKTKVIINQLQNILN